MDEALKPLFERGLKVRKEVLGDAYVDNALNTADEFSMPLQEYITAHAWASSWARPGLEKKTRSMINLAMLTALNRGHEFRIHVKGALNNGVTKEEIREILIQSAVYCGAPAAMDSFRIAKEVFTELGI
ncbi:MAG: 4-carboxymuconolactone decarboxylase [Betaproteobacteria bacterium]|jgi:4-carboxymuconolactone decarboxylase|nr:4-carboxymuconolactone decarboxylase [Betaproteobacteria bacterium]NBX89441.1 4-carboxymuconolactone decarboxylase [Betaproteobacteria bacterium]